jgi:hypothetical protein
MVLAIVCFSFPDFKKLMFFIFSSRWSSFSYWYWW